MICPHCGAQLIADAQFCSRCGNRVVAQQPSSYPPPMPAYAPPALTRVSRHIQALGILWLIYAVWRTLSRFLGLAFAHSYFGWHHHGFGLWPFAFGSAIISLALSLTTAYGLLNRQPWGRILAIICGIFALVHPIMGTALGVYTLWVLAPTVSGVEYAWLTNSSAHKSA